MAKDKPKNEVSYLFLIPNDDEGREFLRLAKKFKTKGYKFRLRGGADRKDKLDKQIGLYNRKSPNKVVQSWRLYIQSKNYNLSHLLISAFEKIKKLRLVDLMRKLAAEFKTENMSEAVEVKRVMERILASYVAGLMKGKYENGR